MLACLTDINCIASICSIIGLVVTVFLFYEARGIKQSFLRRARLPEVNKDLSKLISGLPNQLGNWNADKTKALESFYKIKALLENLESKLPTDQKKKVQNVLGKLEPKRYFIFNESLSNLTENLAWDIYTELCGIVTHLEQLAKDSNWD